MLNIKQSLAKDGVLACTFFGEKDFRVKKENINIVTKKQIEELLRGLEIIELNEYAGDGKVLDGVEQVHIFRIIVKKI